MNLRFFVCSVIIEVKLCTFNSTSSRGYLQSTLCECGGGGGDMFFTFFDSTRVYVCSCSCDSIVVKTGKLIGSVLCLFGGSRLVGWVYHLCVCFEMVRFLI